MPQAQSGDTTATITPQSQQVNHGHRYDSIFIVEGLRATGKICCEILTYFPNDHDIFFERLKSFHGAMVRMNPDDLRAAPGGGLAAEAKFIDALKNLPRSLLVWNCPSVVERMGRKDAVARLRATELGMADTEFYYRAEDFERKFRKNLKLGPRVLKVAVGSNGHGVWIVHLKDGLYGNHQTQNDETNEVEDDEVLLLYDAETMRCEEHTLGEFLRFCIYGGTSTSQTQDDLVDVGSAPDDICGRCIGCVEQQKCLLRTGEGRYFPVSSSFPYSSTVSSFGGVAEAHKGTNVRGLLDQRFCPKVREGEVHLVLIGNRVVDVWIYKQDKQEGTWDVSEVGIVFEPSFLRANINKNSEWQQGKKLSRRKSEDRKNSARQPADHDDMKTLLAKNKSSSPAPSSTMSDHSSAEIEIMPVQMATDSAIAIAKSCIGLLNRNLPEIRNSLGMEASEQFPLLWAVDLMNAAPEEKEGLVSVIRQAQEKNLSVDEADHLPAEDEQCLSSCARTPSSISLSTSACGTSSYKSSNHPSDYEHQLCDDAEDPLSMDFSSSAPSPLFANISESDSEIAANINHTKITSEMGLHSFTYTTSTRSDNTRSSSNNMSSSSSGVFSYGGVSTERDTTSLHPPCGHNSTDNDVVEQGGQVWKLIEINCSCVGLLHFWSAACSSSGNPDAGPDIVPEGEVRENGENICRWIGEYVLQQLEEQKN